MILETIIGDITDAGNHRDIIIGMNTELGELSALGRRFIDDGIPGVCQALGSILTFEFDNDRLLHMIICHNLNENGWRCADMYVRFALDWLWANNREREYSIVEIGKGEVGQKYGADHAAIHTAIATSYLPVTLFVKPPQMRVPAKLSLPPHVSKRFFSPEVVLPR
jgi:hypothetical protein